MANNNRIELGLRLRNARDYLGLSQEEVAAMLGISRSAISLAESGKRRVDTIELQSFAAIYQRSLSELAGEADEKLIIADHLARAAKGLTKDDQHELLEFARFLKGRAESRQRD